MRHAELFQTVKGEGDVDTAYVQQALSAGSLKRRDLALRNDGIPRGCQVQAFEKGLELGGVKDSEANEGFGLFL